MNWLIKYIESSRKRRAIRSYARRLPRLLAKDYGHSERYTPQQVRRTIERSGMNMDFSCYGIAMFSGREDFNQFHQSSGENCDYDIMRGEIAATHFNGNSDFTIADMSNAFHDSGSHMSDGGHHGGGGDSGGSDSGGGGDGGGGD
jgi:hypothetical protein